MRKAPPHRKGDPPLEQIKAVQQRLHALHAAMRVRLVRAEEAYTEAVESIGRELRASASEMTLDEQLNVRTEVQEMVRQRNAMVPFMAQVAVLQELIEAMRLSADQDGQEEDRKRFHLRKILLLLITMYLLQQVLIFQEAQAEELRRIRTKLPGWF